MWWWLATYIQPVAPFLVWMFIWNSLSGFWWTCDYETVALHCDASCPGLREPMGFSSVSRLLLYDAPQLCLLLSSAVMVGVGQSLIPGHIISSTLLQFPPVL